MGISIIHRPEFHGEIMGVVVCCSVVFGDGIRKIGSLHKGVA